MIKDLQINHFIYFKRRTSGFVIKDEIERDKFVREQIVNFFAPKLYEKFVGAEGSPKKEKLEEIFGKASGGRCIYPSEQERRESLHRWVDFQLRVLGDTLLVFILYASEQPEVDISAEIKKLIAITPEDISAKYTDDIIGQSICAMAKVDEKSLSEEIPLLEEIASKVQHCVIEQPFSLSFAKVWCGMMYQEDPWEKYDYILKNQYDPTKPYFTFLFYHDDDSASDFLQRIINIEWYHSKIRYYLTDYIRFSKGKLKEQKQALERFLLKDVSAVSNISLQSAKNRKIKLSQAEIELKELSNNITEFMEAIYFIKQLRESLDINLLNIEKVLGLKLIDGSNFIVGEDNIYSQFQIIVKTKVEQMDRDISFLEKDSAILEIEQRKLDTNIELIRAQQERSLNKWFAVIGTALAVGEVVMAIELDKPTHYALTEYGLKFAIILISALVVLLIYRIFERK